mmetsp:Transcript_30533/g.91213  ORF Transcript_30533/g.91213 Transcript_30533/m.91213 type:complete len:205 (+) Transcript_30533:648-1262(+)
MGPAECQCRWGRAHHRPSPSVEATLGAPRPSHSAGRAAATLPPPPHPRRGDAPILTQRADVPSFDPLLEARGVEDVTAGQYADAFAVLHLHEADGAGEVVLLVVVFHDVVVESSIERGSGRLGGVPGQFERVELAVVVVAVAVIVAAAAAAAAVFFGDVPIRDVVLCSLLECTWRNDPRFHPSSRAARLIGEGQGESRRMISGG